MGASRSAIKSRQGGAVHCPRMQPGSGPAKKAAARASTSLPQQYRGFSSTRGERAE